MKRSRALSPQARNLLSALAGRPDDWQHGYDLDGVIGAGFRAGTAPGLLLCAGCCLILLPAFLRPAAAAPVSTGQLGFGMCWLAVTAASLAGHSPTPLLGFGGSAVLGYLFSAAALVPGTRQEQAA